MGFRMSGGNCCCCKDTIRMAEQHQWSLYHYGGGLQFIKQRVVSPSKDIEDVAAVAWRRTGSTTLYTDGIGALDRKNKNAWFAYGVNRRSGGGAIIGVDSRFCTWDASDNYTSQVFEPGVVRDLFELTDYHVYGMLVDYDAERLVFTGVSYPDPWTDDAIYNDVYHDVRSIAFDGSGNTNHETIQVKRGGSGKGIPGIGGMILHRGRRETYYVVVQNVTTASIADWVYEIRRRNLDDMATDEVVYSTSLYTGVGDYGSSYARGLNSLSLDAVRDKLYWVEHWASNETPSVRQRSSVKRANLDGTDMEVLHETSRPYRVNFVRYSNLLKKIIHQDFSDLPKSGGPLPGTWERSPEDWGDAKMLTLVDSPDTTYHGSSAAQLWCGLEKTGESAVC